MFLKVRVAGDAVCCVLSVSCGYRGWCAVIPVCVSSTSNKGKSILNRLNNGLVVWKCCRQSTSACKIGFAASWRPTAKCVNGAKNRGTDKEVAEREATGKV